MKVQLTLNHSAKFLLCLAKTLMAPKLHSSSFHRLKLGTVFLYQKCWICIRFQGTQCINKVFPLCLLSHYFSSMQTPPPPSKLKYYLIFLRFVAFTELTLDLDFLMECFGGPHRPISLCHIHMWFWWWQVSILCPFNCL